jgi:hypothetical protein
MGGTIVWARSGGDFPLPGRLRQCCNGFPVHECSSLGVGVMSPKSADQTTLLWAVRTLQLTIPT